MRNIKIEESLIVGKHTPEMCEDGIVVTDSHVAVIDGSTSKAANLLPNMGNGRLSMLLISEAIKNLPPQVTCQAFCALVTTHIRDCYLRHGLLADRLLSHPEERLTASVSIYSAFHDEVWMIGDCQCIVSGNHYDNPKPEEERIARKRAAIITKMLEEGTADVAMLQRHDTARDSIVDEIVQTCHSQNVSFSVVDGFPIAMEHVKVIDVSGADEVVMGTDGYPEIYPTLAASEAALAEQLRTDPLCFRRHLATKGLMDGNLSFDDRTYVRFSIIR